MSMGLHSDSTLPSLEPLFGLAADSDLPDGQARFNAISPLRSFIVQAPAGSGKTALLSQRFLALLSQVEWPEQIVAMTFTKKAAAEMRERIIESLRLGLQTQLPADASLFTINTWKLAQQALKRDAEQGWFLLENPNRLRIKTIDGMNGYLVGQMPLLSRMGAQPQVAQDVDSAYQEAVDLTLKNASCEAAVGDLLRLVNGRFNRAESLLVNMLKKRDQWMGNLLGLRGDSAREGLEASLASIISGELQTHISHLSHVQPLLAEACELADYAVSHEQPELAILCGAWPLQNHVKDLPKWRALADWLLTKDDKGLRKSVTKNNGFPAGKGEAKERKEQFVNVLAGLSGGLHATQVVDSLVVLKNLPDPYYSHSQWESLQWLIHLLTVAAGYLKVVFQASGQADFIEIAQAASQALGDALQPTDLAQQLDYQIRHLLVDEFQDTSSEQNALIEKLVAGWQADDGRTLFIVGDPMQSIYRFREAEVGNFLQAWQGRLGEVALSPLNLSVNFRSSQAVVDWVNVTFQKVFPNQSNIEKGAVAYSNAIAFSKDDTPAINPHWSLNQSAEKEAQAIVALIKNRLQVLDASPDSASKTIALLGRSRSSLMGIASLLKQQGIAFRAVELEGLQDRQEVQDILALSRALLHLADRPAWIALLRSPMVGLSLNDLYALMGAEPYAPVWKILQGFRRSSAENVAELDEQQTQKHPEKPNKITEGNDQAWLFPATFSAEGQLRLRHVLPILSQTLNRLGSLPFSVLVRESWLQLDGPQTLESAVALENVEGFLHTLASFDETPLDFQQLDKMIESLYAKADSSPESQRIELMTMHKSKGLEFDTVILPGLGRKPRGNDNELVTWFQFLGKDANGNQMTEFEPYEHLVIAPLDQKGQGTSLLTAMLKRFESQKQRYELARLFYVACTRAKKQLHLFGNVAYQPSDKEDDAPKPPKDSLLEPLWPCVQSDFEALANQWVAPLTEDGDIVRPLPKVSRLPLLHEGFALLRTLRNVAPLERLKPLNNETVAHPNHPAAEDTAQATAPAVEFSPHNALLNTQVGNLVHAVFEQMVDEGINDWSNARITQRLPFYRKWLLQQGLGRNLLDEALRRVSVSLNNALNNPQLRWALASHFEASATELPLSALQSAMQNAASAVPEQTLLTASFHVIDRTFIDEHGTRWIIDYKTSVYDGVDKAAFIERQIALYRPQLERYGQLFAQLENRPQKWVLYFSYLDAWCELH